MDILFLRKGRKEFTDASFAALMKNTNQSLVEVCWHRHQDNSPNESLNFYLDAAQSSTGAPDLFAKIDNDVIVPPGWADQAIATMDAHPELGILGLEPWQSRTPAPWAKHIAPATPDKHWIGAEGYARVDCVGGVFVARRSIFGRERVPVRGTYGGFTDWQLAHPEIVKGWITPPLRLFLLDRLTFEPWASLSTKYEAEGSQRPWTKYGPEAAILYNWWTAQSAKGHE